MASSSASSTFDIKNDADKLDNAIGDYCAYGATTKDELFKCFEETTPGVVRYADSPAGKFARNEAGCEADHGPFCKQAEADQQARQDYEDFKNSGGGY